MPLTAGELTRIRTELGYNALTVGAEPYIGIAAIFSQVVQPYLREGADTTSATAITATGAPVVITLASSTGIGLYDHVGLDVDGLFERVTVRAVAGSTITVIPTKAHPGGYPVSVDNGLMRVREILAALYATHQLIAKLRGTGGLKAVDEIEFYDAKGKTQLDILRDQLAFQRGELSSVIGVPQNEQLRGAGNGGTVALY